MGKPIVVGISDQKIATPPDILVTYALGSCVGICLFDPMRRMGGLAHILLPQRFEGNEEIYKFADTAVEELIRAMERLGCLRTRLKAKIAGGANMFNIPGKTIGDRNVEAVRSELNRMNISILAQDTGADYGRTLQFNPESGIMTIKSMGRGIKDL